ncbi:MAG: thioredoxin fold domain-containing protein [Cytophagales bacterium]|nr:thioredoxin fold domain-containing protein [Bernardetiaceae bacterium]MDW8203565.1 thioredoxin fold domain-containing protein [Cytophagales bacterium]
MKKSKKFIFFLLIALLIVGWACAQPLQLFQGTYTALQNQAKRQNKPYFIFFYTNWCMPCRKIMQEGFYDKNFIEYAEKNYLAYAVDGESLVTEGKKLATFYNVYFYPMILVFTPQGKVVERMDGYLKPDELIALLKRNVHAQGEPTGEYIYLNDDPPMAARARPTGKGLYRMHIEKQPSQGYGLQIGVYENYEAVLREIEKLQANHHRNILVHLNEMNGKTVYHLILGPFNSQRATLTYGEVLESRYGIKGVVVILANMK